MEEYQKKKIFSAVINKIINSISIITQWPFNHPELCVNPFHWAKSLQKCIRYVYKIPSRPHNTKSLHDWCNGG